MWKWIRGYKGSYQVSSFGKIRSVDRLDGRGHKVKGKLLAFSTNPITGYLSVCLCKKGKCKSYLVHRLVAEVWIRNPKNKPEVNHKNLNKADNRIENLEWASRKWNKVHAVLKGIKFNPRPKRGTDCPFSVLTVQQVLWIRKILKKGILNQRQVAEKLNITQANVSSIWKRKTWTHI